MKLWYMGGFPAPLVSVRQKVFNIPPVGSHLEVPDYVVETFLRRTSLVSNYESGEPTVQPTFTKFAEQGKRSKVAFERLMAESNGTPEVDPKDALIDQLKKQLEALQSAPAIAEPKKEKEAK